MGFIGKGITGAVETGKIINKYFDEGVKTLGDVKDYVEDLISKGIIFRGSDLEKMSPEDLMAAKAQRDRILLETQTNKPLNIQLTKKQPEVEDVDIFADDISQVDATSPTVQVSLDFEKGKDSVLATINRVKYDSGNEGFSKVLDKNTKNLQDAFGELFNDIDNGKPLDYKFFRENFADSYQEKLEKAKKSSLKFNQKQFDRYIDLVEENYQTAFEQFKSLPKAVQKELLVTGKNPFSYDDMAQNYSTMPISQKLAIFAGDMNIPIRHPGNDFFQRQYESSIISNMNREREYLTNMLEQKVTAPYEYFYRQGEGAYAYEVDKLNKLVEKDKMIKSLEQNIRDLKEKYRMMQEEGIEAASKDYFAAWKNEYGQAIKNYNNALYDKYKPIIPTLEKGHELMRIRREELFRSGDRANVDQVAYPTFFTNFVRNRMHIKLEEHLIDYLKQYKEIKQNPMIRGSKTYKTIDGLTVKNLEKRINAIKLDMTTLGTPSKIFDEATGKFRLYGKAFENPLQLYKSIRKKNKKLHYINTEIDKDPFNYSGEGTFEKKGEVFLDTGYKDGGFASLEEVLEY
tara:strand:+ start:1989 stop:3701 length:1713 start_codon:yes stop_codon:yes gene_type:complete